MKMKWLVRTISIILVLFVAFVGLAGNDSSVAAQDEGSKIEGLLLDRFAADGSADFIVRFTEKADLSAAYGMDWNARGEYVYNSLLETATRSQANAIAILNGSGYKNQSLIGGNDLYVWGGNIAVANELATLPEVEFIRATRTYYIDPIVVVKPLENISWAGDFLANKALTTVGNSPTATTDWGITDTKADQAWLLGARGAGIKVANIDTGVQWNHPALVNQFACASGNDSNCWADPSNICGGTACDNNGHGTHTMGSMVSKDDPSLTYIAGMAPDATWIACKGCETNSCSDFALTSCADWILAPGGDPNNRPHVVNNSWGGGSGNPWYLAYVNAWRADGVFPAFSAGNNYTCSSLGSPGDYQESFATASHMSNRNISDFSSKGASLFGHEPYTKPNISAPGSSICSTVPTNGWNCGYSGTSMASPHTAGAVAQLYSCAPGLIGQVDATFQALQNSANTPPAGSCGAPPDGQGNYTFGYGYLDALNLVSLNCAGGEFGTLEGHVYDQDGNPVEGASVTAQPVIAGNGIDAFTDPNGYYTMDLLVGTYDVTATKANFTPQTVNGVVIAANQTTTQDFTINFLGAWTQLSLGLNCPDWTRLDMEYYAGTGLAYALGGRSGTATDGTIWAYDPTTNLCTNTGTTMPVPISNYSIVPVNNGSADLLCTFGGRPAAGGVTPAVQCFDPVANTVSQVSTLPGVLASFVPGGENEVGGKVIVYGGFQNIAAPYETIVTYEWDPVANSWTQKGDLPLGMGYIQSATVDGKVYAFGGTVFDGVNLVAQTKTAVYDPALGTWDDASIAELPTAGAEGRAFGFDTASEYAFAGKIIIAGGGQWPAETADVFSYDIATNTYDPSIPDLNILRRDHAGFFVPGDPAGRMFVFGGRTSAVGYGGDSPPYAPPEYFEVPVTTQAPAIVIDPLQYDAVVLPDGSTSLPMTITNEGNADLTWQLYDGVLDPSWSDNFDSYPTGQQLHGEGGWKGWDNSPGAGALTSDVQAQSAPNSVAILGGSDLTHPYSGYTSGAWTYTAWQYIPINFSGTTYFILLNTYNDGGPYNWSLEMQFDSASGNVINDGPDGGTLPMVLGQWVEIRVEIDLDADTQSVYYDGTLLFSGSWTEGMSGGGVLEIANVDLFANGASVVYYDDISLIPASNPTCGVFGDVSWLSTNPTNGTTLPDESSNVDVLFDATGLPVGVYTANLCAESNDITNPLIPLPVTMTVVENARVAVAHLAPFAMDPGTAVTITLNGTPALTDFAFADSTAYIDLFPGEYLVEVWPMGAVEPAITATVDLVGGTDYSVVAIGDGVNQPLELMALVDENTPPATGKFHLRLGHLAPFASTGTEADICLQDGTPIFTDVPYGVVAPYLPLDAGTYDLVIAAPGTNCDTVLIDPKPVTFVEGQIVTAFAVGNGTLQSLGVFAWPSNAVGFLLPLEEGYMIYLPLIFKDFGE